MRIISYQFARKWPGVVIGALIFINLLTQSTQAQDRTVCLEGTPDAPSVYIASATSDVEVRKSDGSKVDATQNLLLCPGDEIRTGATERVAIGFEKKQTVLRLDGSGRVRVLTAGTGEGDVQLLSGTLHFLSSVRRRFQVDTPYFLAGIDGTEALVTVEPARRRAIAAVRQGLISAYKPKTGQENPILVAAGEAAFTSPRHRLQSAPIAKLPSEFRQLLIVSASAVDWAVYYPPILLVRNVGDNSVRRAIGLMSSGDYERAAIALNSAPGARRAASAALRAIIEVGRNRLPEAERWSELAIKTGPDFAPSYVAASYVRQAYGDLKGALVFARQAADTGPQDAYALARLAELQMTVGDRRGALETADRSIAVAPNPLALFVAGLANLVANDYATAEAQFVQASKLDNEAPLPRLGLGLLYIRQGMTAAGTWQLELAAAHDPRRAALRTWLGRAYFDEGLTIKAADQFRLAKQQGPNDPAPHVFSALERVAANRPIQALADLLEAEKRADARRVIRSERGLAEDAAARGATLGRVFDLLNFDQLAIITGSNAAYTDPSNPATHRFLADYYRSQPGLGNAQTSELLRGQLLSPPSKTPVQPQLAEADLAILGTTGISRVTFAEYSPLFDADGVRLDASGLLGTQKTWSDEVSVTGLYRGMSLSVGQFHYETDGYHDNNDLSHDIFNAVSTVAVSPEFTLFGEYRHRETESGDRRLNFELSDFDRTARSAVEREVARVGFHAQPTNTSDLIGVYTRASLSTDASAAFFGLPITSMDDQDAHSGQLQYLRDDGMLRSVIGGAYIHNDRSLKSTFLGIPDPPIIFDADYFNAYAYFYLDFPMGVTWTLGGSAVSYKESDGAPDIFQFHPKIGATVKLNDYITLRGAYLRNLKPNRTSEQQIEPTTIAGFSQSFDALDGSILDQVGGAIDIKFNDRTWIGGEVVHRWWDVAVGGAPNAETKEQVYRGYLYLTLSEDFAFTAEIVHEESKSDAPVDFEKWKTTSVPVRLSYFSDSRIFGSVGVEFVDHSFSDPGVGGKDEFALVDAAIGFRFPKNAGSISIEVQNLFDERIGFQNRSIRAEITAPPRFAPKRTVVARGTLKF